MPVVARWVAPPMTRRSLRNPVPHPVRAIPGGRGVPAQIWLEGDVAQCKSKFKRFDGMDIQMKPDRRD